MLLGMRGEEEIKEKLLSFSSFLSPNLNISYNKLKISLRNKSIIYCQVLACHDSQVRLSQTAHSDFFFLHSFLSRMSQLREPPAPRHRECAQAVPWHHSAHSDCSRHSLADQSSLQFSLFDLQCWSLKNPKLTKTSFPLIRLRSLHPAPPVCSSHNTHHKRATI